MSRNIYMDVFVPQAPKVSIGGGTIRFQFPDAPNNLGHQITFFASNEKGGLTIRELIENLKKQFNELEIPAEC